MKKVSHKKLLRRTLYVCSGTLLLLNSGVGVASVFVINQNRAQASQVNPRAGLADISILQNASLTSTTGTQMTPNAQGNFDLSLNYTGQGVATVGVADKKVLVYALPASLQGKVVGGSTVDIQADLLPITPGDIPGVKPLFDALGLAITALDKALKIPAVVAAFNNLKKVQDLGSYQETVTANVSPDGKTISVDFTQGFGRYVHQAYAALFDTLRDAIAAVHSDNILIEALVKALQKASADLFAIIDAIAGGTSTILDSALSGNLLGSASGTLHTTVSDPGVPTATVKAAAINNALISADILTAIEQEGEAVTLNFPTTATNPIENYDVATPTVTQPVAGQTTVAGNVILKEPIPDGTTFEAVVTLDDGTTKTATVQADGTFVVDTGALTAGQILSTKVVATNGQYTKESTAVESTVSDVSTENPIENYDVATPTVNPATAGDTKLDGQVTLNQPIPDGTTFKAVATLADGTEVSGDVDVTTGKFSVTTDPLVAGDLKVKVVATNGQYTKSSTDVTVTVAAAPIENPIENYDVASPTVDPATAGDTSLDGQVTLNQPIPDGTTFKAVATLADGTEVSGDVNTTTGKFSIGTDPLVAGDVTVKIVATNGQFTKSSTDVTVTVADAPIENPIENYDVATPTVDPATAGDTTLDGQVTLNQPIPAGTTFKAVATLANGTEISGDVDTTTGKFSIGTDPLVAGDVTVKIVATNGQFTKPSANVTVTVADAPIENPIENYDVATPTVEKSFAGDTSVKGHIDLKTPIPDNTTFEATVTLPGGRQVKADVQANGDFTVNTEDPLVAGSQLAIHITAINGQFTKEGAAINSTVADALPTDPLVNYQVTTPTLDSATDGQTKVSGHVNLQVPIPDGTTFKAEVQLPDGATVAADVQANGDFEIPTRVLVAGESLSVKVIAQNGIYQKESAPASLLVSEAVPTNPLENYTVATPDVNPMTTDDTQLTGKVTLTDIPAGTTFEAVVTMADGSTKRANVSPEGQFTIETGQLAADDVLSVKITAKNSGYTKDSASVDVTVTQAPDTNPLANYTVAQPVVDAASAGDTTVTGKVDLTTNPAPAGTTFEATVMLPDGTLKTAEVADDGTFTVTTGELKADDILEIHITAHNSGYQKDSNPVQLTVDAAVETNPLENYTVNAPVVAPLTEGDTAVKGQVNLGIPIPNGTTFEVIVTLADGTTKSVAIGADGQFTVPTEALVADETVAVKVVATNGTFTKDSSVVYQKVSQKLPTDPIADYEVGTPTVDPVTADQTSVTGQVVLAEPIPEGTSFEATVTLADGTQKTATVDENGHFTIVTGNLTEGDQLTVKVTAKNSIYTKDSALVTVNVGPAVEQNPLADYDVNMPVLNPAKAGETHVSGSVTLKQPAPAGTTFEASVTLQDGTTTTATILPSGEFTVGTKPLTAGEILSAKVTAINGNFKKDSQTVSLTVDAGLPTNPLENYDVATPMMQPAVEGDKAIKGQVTLVQPIPNGTSFKAMITLPDGTTKETTINSSGQFELTTDALVAGQTYTAKVVATNGANMKESQSASVTVSEKEETDPLVDYNVATPTIKQGVAGETQVSGQVQLDPDWPEGTTFEAVIVLPNGRTRAVRLDSGAVAPDGQFTINTAALTANQKVLVKIVAKNGTFTKDSANAEMIVKAAPITDPLENYDVATPSVDPVKAGDTKVTGKVELVTPIPEGTTFEAVVTLPNGDKQTVTIDENGNFNIPIDAVKEGDQLTVEVIAHNGDHEKGSDKVNVTVEAGNPGETNPLENYDVAKPSVDPVKAGDTKVTGKVELVTPIPEGTTFEAVVTLPNGDKQTVTIDENGNFNVPIDAVKEGDKLTVEVIAHNGDHEKGSDKVNVTVEAGNPGETNPLENYDVAKPSVDPVKAGDTKVTGKVELTKPIPDGTTFEAVVTLPNGDKQTVTIDENGNFNIPIDAVKEGDQLTVEVVAHNGDHEKGSDKVNVTVEAGNPGETNPLENYVVAKPSVDPVKAGDTKVTGKVELVTPIPEGTTFEAVVTLPNGDKQTVTIDENGNFNVPVDAVKEGDKLTVEVIAHNGDHEKASDKVSVTVEAGNPGETNPLENYVVAKPSVDPVKAGDTKVTGKVVLTKPIPKETTFEAVVTLPSGKQVKVTVDENGNFTLPIDAAKAGDKLTVEIIAHNGDHEKASDKVNVTVEAGNPGETNPLENYVVAKPSVDPVKAGDTKVTGKVILTKPIPKGTTFEAVVTLPNGKTVKVAVDSNGNFTLPVDAVKEGDKLTVEVIAHNGDHEKGSDKVNVTVEAGNPGETNPLENYVVAKPSVDPVKAGDTKVTGKVVLTQPIPEGTTFEAVVTLPNGKQVKVTVDSNGNFTLPVGAVKKGDKLIVEVIAHNGNHEKGSDKVNVTVEAGNPGETNPLENYVVAKPSVDPVKDGDTKVTGKVELTKPIPEGTTFEAVVTLPSGKQVKVTVDENGNFTLPIDAAKAGDKLTVEIIAHNGDHEKGSDKVNVTVEAGNPGETNPLENYVVAKPSVDPVKAGDTQVTGKVTINKPFPEGTTFEASVTMPDGSVKYGMVDINGNFIVKTGQLKAGQRLIVTIIAHNGDFEKDGQPVTVRVADNNQDGSGNGNGGTGNNTGNGGNTNGNSNGSHNPGNNNAGNGGQTNNGGNGQLGNSNNVNNLTNNGSNSGQNNHHMLNVGVSDTTGSQNANSKAGDLPQTDANKTGVWAAVGAFLIAMVALFKSLLPIKRDK
ncbi:adhesive domain-containing protein [Latilactobacillus sakei]|uniref:adhesive domain-containing protein n=1 Tax=Latilactobacillus sakei TaxID=1599 RepID=UPI000DCA9CDB|nr:adhesive domain-containing protein [Latilactobacillus sakei]AWZ43822.1 hypothetical protein CXB68_01810 [Latilactobacillus sakei]